MKCPKCDTENTQDSQYCKVCATSLTGGDAPPSITQTIETPREELKRGTLFANRYEIIEELGKGGMGRVYRVFDNKIDSEVALKLVRSDIAADKNTVERFRNELKLARDITHKSVCRMYDLNEEQGTHYITMEYVSGGDLKRFIRRSGQLSIGTALKIAIQLCEGLSEAHKLGVIHRDLKPNNIMIDAQGNARIMDFGIARSLSTKGITARGVMIGTPEYMSPEQVEGKEVDPRSDVYSLGIILYEMVTGRVPFEGDTPFTIGVKHKSETPKDPREFNTQITEDLGFLIMKCLEKGKENRYQNTGEVLSVLNQIEKGIPTTERPTPKSKPITSKEITVRFTPKRLFVPVAVILILAIIAYVIFRRPAVKLDPNHVVVGIFENQTGNESLNRLGQYAAHTVSEDLSQTGMFDIVPFDAVIHFNESVGGDKRGLKRISDIRHLARESGAGTEISGTYILLDETLSFHVQIIDVKSGKSLVPVTKTDGRNGDEEQIVKELSEKISGALASHFNFDYGRAYDYRPPLYSAYREYRSGVDLFDTDNAQSIMHFERALELDPTYSPANIGLLAIYMNRNRFDVANSIISRLSDERDQLSPLFRHELDAPISRLAGNIDRVAYHYQEARKLDPRNRILNYLVFFWAPYANRPGEAVKLWNDINQDWVQVSDLLTVRTRGAFSLVAGAYHMLGKYRQELKVIRQGEKDFPDSFYMQEARAMAALGKIEKVKSIIEKSHALSSRDIDLGGIMSSAAKELREHGHYSSYNEIANQAVNWYKGILTEEDVTSRMRLNLAEALYVAERWDEAQLEFEELAKEFIDIISWQGYFGNPSDIITCKGYLATLAARRGDREKALQISEELKNLDHPYLFGRHTQWRARIASLLGEKKEAFSLLRESLMQGRCYGLALLRDMDFEPLRDYKPFQDLLKPKG